MKAVDSDLLARVEKNELIRQLHQLEKGAAEIRSQLGLVQRVSYENVLPDRVPTDGVTRLRTDQVDRLYEAGKINGDVRAACLKFRAIFEAMSRGLFAGGASMSGSSGKNPGRYRHPLERMTERELTIWFMEYRPWANGIGNKTAIEAPGFKKSFLQVAYAVIIDNFGPSQIETMWPISRGNGIIVKALRKGLGEWRHLDEEVAPGILAMRREIIEEARNKVSLAASAS